MYQTRLFISRIILTAAMALLLVLPAGAAELQVEPLEEVCFTAENFTLTAADEGIFLTEVPNTSAAVIYYGDRVLHAGDALTADALDELTVISECISKQDLTVGFYTISDDRISGSKELKILVVPKNDTPPVAKDYQLETYKNISNSGELSAEAANEDTLTFLLTSQPKRGTVELYEDGTFTYTPDKNKVGKDSFTFVVQDEDGNQSYAATVSIVIKKPSDKAVYTDMANDPDAYEAMWLKDRGVFSGEAVGGNLCFSPDTTVSRGEFLVMVMDLVHAEADEAEMTSGFADELDTPVWMQPYIVTALNHGLITGFTSDQGVIFRPAASMTKAETVVMLQNILQLPAAETTAVFAQSENAIPVWAADAAAALSQAGVELRMEGEADPLTRRDAANILYKVDRLLEQEKPVFFWEE